MLHKNYKRKFSVGKKNTGSESQGGCRQDELIGGKPQSYSNPDSDSGSDNELFVVKRIEKVSEDGSQILRRNGEKGIMLQLH
jgi:hypothetical protein